MKKIYLLNDTSREIGHIGCTQTISNILSACEDHNMEVIFRDMIVSGDFDSIDFRKKIAECDALLVNGEGTLHHNAANSLFLKCLIAKEEGKSVFLINSVWQENNLTRKYVDIFDLIYVRETLSEAAIREDGRHIVSVVPDMIFYSSTDIVTKSIGIGGIVIDSVIGEISKELAEFSVSEKLPFYFMGQWHKNNFFKKNRWFFILPWRMKGKKVIGNIAEISDREYVITGRYHGACLAMIVGVPFIAVSSNTHKIQGIIKDAGIDDLIPCILQKDLNIQSLKNAKNKIKEVNKSEYRKRVSFYRNNAKKRISDMFLEISQF